MVSRLSYYGFDQARRVHCREQAVQVGGSLAPALRASALARCWQRG